MTGALQLRPGARVGRWATRVVVDPAELRMDAAEVVRALLEPQIAVLRVEGVGVEGPSGVGALVLLPGGALAWLAADALRCADDPGFAFVVRPAPALAAETRGAWVECEPPEDAAWQLDRLDAEYVYLRLVGRESPPLYRVLPEDVAAVDDDAEWRRICPLDLVDPAATLAAWELFVRRFLGGDERPTARSGERWGLAVELPGGEPAAPRPTDAAPTVLEPADTVGPVVARTLAAGPPPESAVEAPAERSMPARADTPGKAPIRAAEPLGPATHDRPGVPSLDAPYGSWSAPGRFEGSAPMTPGTAASAPTQALSEACTRARQRAHERAHERAPTASPPAVQLERRLDIPDRVVESGRSALTPVARQTASPAPQGSDGEPGSDAPRDGEPALRATFLAAPLAPPIAPPNSTLADRAKHPPPPDAGSPHAAARPSLRTEEPRQSRPVDEPRPPAPSRARPRLEGATDYRVGAVTVELGELVVTIGRHDLPREAPAGAPARGRGHAVDPSSRTGSLLAEITAARGRREAP